MSTNDRKGLEQLSRSAEEQEELAALYKHLEQSNDDIKHGRVRPANEVFDELIKELNKHLIYQ